MKIEAINFLASAYEKQLILNQDLLKTFQIMILTTSDDFNWEVRKQSLCFWEKVIVRQLQMQGMLDDDFPQHVFSIEHKKIISLTDPEIKNRLLKTLKELDTIGCLKMLMSTIQNDCDLDVTKTAIKILDKLSKLFKKYQSSSIVLSKNSATNSQHNNPIQLFITFCKQDFEQVLQNKKKNYKQNEKMFRFLNKMLPLDVMEVG